jgi:formate hydrogenlyase subunit 3/multisubunit Na+/H+ antiporter MnhD subunit
MPFGSFSLHLNPLSALFLMPIFFVSAVAALYGHTYMSAYYGKDRWVSHWFFFNLLIGSMALVVVAANAVLFLIAWELMSLSSFFLVMHEDHKKEVREAGWIYLVATHIGTAFLIVMFMLLGHETGSFDFDSFKTLSSNPATAPLLNTVFILACIGFGTKAGFIPLHTWLPEAHPAAPSHVSAIMSGVMIKTGIYGIVFIITLIQTPPLWWGWVLLGIGASSGIAGVLFALAQHDLKRLLAYHSVENIGIIALGLGLGLIGMSTNSPPLIVLGFAGGLLHVINHALFKGLLFLGAGAIIQQIHIREIDEMGGLLKKMRWTGLFFLIGAIAICGLPPLNGFISEFLLYLGFFKGITTGSKPVIVPAIIAIASLALIGGLAAACFTKAFGIMFLGEPRSNHVKNAHEVNGVMIAAQALLATACVLIGLFSPVFVRPFLQVITLVSGLDLQMVQQNPGHGLAALTTIQYSVLGLCAVICLIIFIRRRLLASRTIGSALTWDCGYAVPTSRMQYTASSYAQPLIDMSLQVLHTHNKTEFPNRIFPKTASFSSETPDLVSRKLFGLVFRAVLQQLSKIRQLQHGQTHLYILYIVITLLVLLIWKM